MEETKQLNFYNVQIRKGRKIVAHVSCNYSDEKIQIRDLYVLEKYRKMLYKSKNKWYTK